MNIEVARYGTGTVIQYSILPYSKHNILTLDLASNICNTRYYEIYAQILDALPTVMFQ